MAERVTHWLRTNRAARVPRRVVCFDSEARIERKRGREEQTFRLACASFDALDADGIPLDSEGPSVYRESGELWAAVSAFTSTQHRTVAFAHKLDYDLRLTAALEHLPALGFDLKGIALNSYSCWARFANGKRSLWLCDSLSWLPASLDRIAAMTNTRKKPLPAEDAPDADWLRRCLTDVETLRAAMLHIIRLLRVEDLGDFRLTGAAQASAAFRHRFLAERTLLVHSDRDALDAERRAAFAGRCEVWRHGKVRGPLYEYDFTASYAHIAEACDVPTRLLGEHTPIGGKRLDAVMQHRRVLANVTVSTERPTVPCWHEGRILWPVGEFKTTLWDTELQLLAREGGSFDVERLWLYARAPVLRPWARWVLAALDGKPPGDDPLARLMLKEWSRALIGRFGLRYPVLDELGRDTNFDVAMYPVRDDANGCDTTYLQIGQQLFEQNGRDESRNSTPMVMSWVMAQARVNLWRLMRSVGLDQLAYVDTDGVITGRRSALHDDRAATKPRIAGVRLKETYPSADFRAPRNIDVGDSRRVTGVPRRAERLREGVYRAEVWESLPGSLRRRRPSTVVLSERLYSIADRDPRRLHLPDGSTEPIRLEPDGSGPAPASSRSTLTAV